MGSVVQASSLKSIGHLSALDATSVTHSIRLDWGHSHNPSFRTTNEKYGQRLPLEQVNQLSPWLLQHSKLMMQGPQLGSDSGFCTAACCVDKPTLIRQSTLPENDGMKQLHMTCSTLLV